MCVFGCVLGGAGAWWCCGGVVDMGGWFANSCVIILRKSPHTIAI